MSYTEGRRRYDEISKLVEGDEYGQMCLQRLVQYEAYIPCETLDARELDSGDEEAGIDYTQNCLRSTGCMTDRHSGQVVGLIFPLLQHNEKVIEEFALKAGLTIQFSNALPFYTINVGFDNTGARPTEAALEAFVTNVGLCTREIILSELHSERAEARSGSRSHGFFNTGLSPKEATLDQTKPAPGAGV